MSLPEVSVIIPIYNSEHVLGRCVDSVLCQSCKEFELLLINDGSTDLSGAICDEYARKDDRIKVIHQTNGGPSRARNAGLEIAKGTWICFIDSDDWVEPEYIHGFLNQTNLDQTTLIIQSFYDVYVDNNEVTAKRCHRSYNHYEVDVQNVDELIIDCRFLRDGYPFCKLYNAHIIRENIIRFDQQMHFSEDAVFLLSYLPFIKKLCFTDECAYNHTISGSSLSSKYYGYKSEIWAFKQILQSLEFLKPYDVKEVDNEIASFAGLFLSRAISSMYRPDQKIRRSERLQKIQSLHDAENIKCYVAYNNLFFRRIVAFMFKRKMYFFMDSCLYVQFGLRYSFEPLWHLYLKIKRWSSLERIKQIHKVV